MGDRLTDEQIKKIVRKRFTGWGRLSRKLLTEIKVDSDNGPVTIMDVLREGNPNHSGRSLGKPMVFMEVLRDDDLGFQERIDVINREYMLGATALALEDLPGSPALRRGINQALAIVEEIVHIAGHAPENIFIEVTREDDAKKRGKRTKRRYDALKEAMAALKEESPEFWNADVARDLVDSASDNRDLDERLTLYFMQGGKSLYSGKPLDIGQLSSGKYHVDHIIPQAYVKDDSFENKALVLASENEAKSDQMLIDASIRKKMRSYWEALKQAGLIGEKKYNNLLRSSIGDRQMKGFIARAIGRNEPNCQNGSGAAAFPVQVLERHACEGIAVFGVARACRTGEVPRGERFPSCTRCFSCCRNWTVYSKAPFWGIRQSNWVRTRDEGVREETELTDAQGEDARIINIHHLQLHDIGV